MNFFIKKSVMMLMGVMILSACTITLDSIEPARASAIFCHKQGGTAVAQRNQQGDYDLLCRLPDGTMVDELDYYRQHQNQQKPN